VCVHDAVVDPQHGSQATPAISSVHSPPSAAATIGSASDKLRSAVPLSTACVQPTWGECGAGVYRQRRCVFSKRTGWPTSTRFTALTASLGAAEVVLVPRACGGFAVPYKVVFEHLSTKKRAQPRAKPL